VPAPSLPANWSFASVEVPAATWWGLLALTADHLIIIGRGRLLSSGPVADFIEQSAGHHVKVVTPDADTLVVLLRDKGATITVDGPQELSVQGLESRDIGILASAAGLTLYEMSTQRASLEDAFMELTHEHAEYKGTTQYREASRT
jgi:ABC-2 type transport system ATP-binding protein